MDESAHSHIATTVRPGERSHLLSDGQLAQATVSKAGHDVIEPRAHTRSPVLAGDRGAHLESPGPNDERGHGLRSHLGDVHQGDQLQLVQEVGHFLVRVEVEREREGRRTGPGSVLGARRRRLVRIRIDEAEPFRCVGHDTDSEIGAPLFSRRRHSTGLYCGRHDRIEEGLGAKR